MASSILHRFWSTARETGYSYPFGGSQELLATRIAADYLSIAKLAENHETLAQSSGYAVLL
jgi:hypothetical protein